MEEGRSYFFSQITTVGGDVMYGGLQLQPVP
jgi:hypothetical protein